MRTFGSYAGKLRRMAADFQRQFDEAMREAEIEEVQKGDRERAHRAPRSISSADRPADDAAKAGLRRRRCASQVEAGRQAA